MHNCIQTKLKHTTSFQQLFIILISARSFAGPLLNARTLTYYRNGGWSTQAATEGIKGEGVEPGDLGYGLVWGK